jgi:hypothetical protein
MSREEKDEELEAYQERQESAKEMTIMDDTVLIEESEDLEYQQV